MRVVSVESASRAGERREALRLLLLARRSAVNVRREALVQLRSVIVTCPDRLRVQLRRLPAGRLVARCSRFRRSNACTPDELANTTQRPRTTSHAASPKAKQPATPSEYSSATSPATSTGYYRPRNR
jgi:hypothetical protein